MNHDDNNHDEATAPAQPQVQPARSRRWVMAGLIIAVTGATTVGTARLAGAAQGLARHHDMGSHAAMDPAAMDRHIGELVDNVLTEGTPQQKARLAAIIRSAHADLAPAHQQFQQAHERARTLIMQPNVDRAALETLRADQVRQLDAVSRRLVQALGDAADMLTPEQRGRLFDHLQSRMH
jgi:protein CpxP